MLNRVVMNKFAIGASIILSAGLALSVFAAEAAKPKKEGFTDTPMGPGGKWHVHDSERPKPPIITPGECSTQDKAGTAPSDAIVLFDGKDFSHWQSMDKGKAVEPKWKIEDGCMVAEKGAGSVFSKESFGDMQLHIEWSAPTPPVGSGQGRGNSGVIIMGKYEVQVLDSYDNVTYADGQAGAVYGQYPPLVNACRKPGEWQSYDIIFEAPKFGADQKLVKPAYVTVLHNGVLIQNHQEIIGAMAYKKLATYSYHEPELPLMLQFHGNPVRYRNIWVRKIGQADEAPAEKKAE
jgi:hypothetical protein